MISNLQDIVSAATSSGGSARTFGQLTVRERVIDTGGRAIAVSNISTISVATLDKRLKRLLLWIAAAVATFFAIVRFTSYFGFDATTALAFAFAGFCAWLAFSAKDVTTLVIGTNDGARTLFSGTDGKFLAEIKTFLADKINTGDQRGGTFIIDQSKRDIHVGAINTGPITTGSNNQIASHSPQARFGTHETYRVENSPNAQVGTGHKSNGARVDYSSVLPDIEQWQRHTAQSEGWTQVANQLAELQTLLRAGTPTKEEKGKVRSLATDLSTVLQGYPAAVQLFQAVSRLAGF
jgi:hypothetical protein